MANEKHRKGVGGQEEEMARDITIGHSNVGLVKDGAPQLHYTSSSSFATTITPHPCRCFQ